MGRLWSSLGKSAWGMRRDFSSHFAECCLNPLLENGGKMDKARVEEVTNE